MNIIALTLPQTKIEVYDASDAFVTLLHTVTNGCTDIEINSVLNGIGTFNVALPVQNAVGLYRYGNIDKGDKVEVWLSTTSTFSANPDFVGYVQQINGQATNDGYIRVLSGKDGMEAADRIQLHAYQWNGVDSHDIVDDIATACGYGTGSIAADTNEEVISVETESYLDILRRVSDYWVDAVNQVKKDFYVDVSNNLVWAARPIRSASVETISTSYANLKSYKVYRPYNDKTNIRVIGNNTKRYPAAEDPDTLTDSTASWNIINGDTLTLDTTTRVEGSGSIKCVRNAGTGTNDVSFYRSISSTPVSIGADRYKRINFWWAYSVGSSYVTFYLLCPDTSNYVGCYLIDDPTKPPPYNTFLHYSRSFHAPSDFDITVGSPDFSDCQGIQFYHAAVADIQLDMWVDGLYIDDCSYSGTATTGSANRYMEVTDRQLKSDSDCGSRAETLLYKLQSAPIRVDVELEGNLNVKIGDRVPVTIDAEGISASNYDVLNVKHVLHPLPIGFRTYASMVEAGDARILYPNTTNEAVTSILKQDFKQVSKGTNYVGSP